MILLGEVNYENLTVIGVAASLIAWLVRMYVPKIVDRHLEFVQTVESQGERQTQALEQLASRDATEHARRTNEALSHGANAVAGLVSGTERESVVMPHVQAMKSALRSQ